VLFLISSAERRGAQIQAYNLVGALGRRGVQASLAALVAGSPGGLDVAALGRRPFDPSTLRALRRAARSHDLVVAFGSTTLPACALALGGAVPWIYRSIGDPGSWVRGRLHRERTGVLMRRASAVVALWPGAAVQIRGLYRVGPDRLHAIPNGRNPELFPPVQPGEQQASRAALGVGPEGPVALILGALSEEKRVADAIQAVSQLPDVRLVVAGDGPERRALGQLADSVCPGRVTFLGSVSNPGAVLAAADVTVLTSRTEGLPGAILESLYRGVPVVATEVGGVSSLVETGVNGLLVPAGDVPAIAGGVREVLSWPPGAALANRSALVRSHGIEAVTDRWVGLLGTLAG